MTDRISSQAVDAKSSKEGFKIAYTIREACDATGIGRTTLYELIGAGRVRAVKVGSRTLIPRSSLTALFDEPSAAA